MIEVNLLPREYRKRATPFHFDKKLMYAGGAVAVVFLLLVGVTIYKQHSINTLDKKIVSIEKQRKALDKDIRLIDNLTDLKQKLLTRMAGIETLDRKSRYVGFNSGRSVQPDSRAVMADQCGG